VVNIGEDTTAAGSEFHGFTAGLAAQQVPLNSIPLQHISRTRVLSIVAFIAA